MCVTTETETHEHTEALVECIWLLHCAHNANAISQKPLKILDAKGHADKNDPLLRRPKVTVAIKIDP